MKKVLQIGGEVIIVLLLVILVPIALIIGWGIVVPYRAIFKPTSNKKKKESFLEYWLTTYIPGGLH